MAVRILSLSVSAAYYEWECMQAGIVCMQACLCGGPLDQLYVTKAASALLPDESSDGSLSR